MYNCFVHSSRVGPLMNASSPVVSSVSNDFSLSSIGSAESARYTKDMLETLRRIADRHEQIVLARLLETAAREAGRLACSPWAG